MKNRDMFEAIRAIRNYPVGDERCTGWIEALMDDYANIEMMARFVSEEHMDRMKDNPDDECWLYKRSKAKKYGE